MHLARLEHFVYPVQSLAGFGEEYYAAHGPVKPVHYAEERAVWLIVFFGDIFLYFLFKRFVAGFVYLHNIAGTFIYGNNVVIFIQHIIVGYLAVVVYEYGFSHSGLWNLVHRSSFMVYSSCTISYIELSVTTLGDSNYGLINIRIEAKFLPVFDWNFKLI